MEVFFIALNFNPNLKHGKFKALRASFPLLDVFFFVLYKYRSYCIFDTLWAGRYNFENESI